MNAFLPAARHWIPLHLAQENSLWALSYLAGPLLALVFLYRYLNDPLHSIPGPFLAKFTGAWILLVDLSGSRSGTVHRLHQKYGPAVRVGPNQVCFASPQALKEIYGSSSKYTKAPVYESLGFTSTFTTRERDEYRTMKKRILPSFSPAAVAEMEAYVHHHVTDLIKCFDKRVDTPLDVLPWFRMLALSIVGEGFAGESFHGLETEETPKLLQCIDEVFPALWVWWMFPVTSSILQYSPFKIVRKFLRAGENFRTATYKNYTASYDPSTRHDLIARMVNEQTALLGQNQSLPRHVTEAGIVDELTNLIFAGTDTTSNTLAYLFWELANHPEWQLRLREELKEAVGNTPNPEYNTISELPVLEAIVQEILRLRPAAPAGLQRVTPESGGFIDGVAIPPGAIVSCQALSAQREPTIFPEPDHFNPQRWLDAEISGNLELMREQIMVFGKGARACVGRRLATMEIKCAIVEIVRRYHTKIGSPTTDKDMEMMDYNILIPKGQRCVLRLTRV